VLVSISLRHMSKSDETSCDIVVSRGVCGALWIGFHVKNDSI